MCHAVRVVRIGEVDYLRASKYFSVPRGCERYIPFSRGVSKCAFRKKKRKSKRLEYCITMDQCYGLRSQDIKHMAFQLAIRNGVKRPFNQEKSEAGKKCLRPFF